MRLCSIVYQGHRRLALHQQDQVSIPTDGPLSEFACVADLIHSDIALTSVAAQSDMLVIPADEVQLQAPLSRLPRNVICLGWNYLEHARESVHSRRPDAAPPDRPEHPIVFTKAPETVIGPMDDVPASGDVTRELDWEVELAVVIGRPAWKLSEGQALEHVFGYTVVNDISARDIQFRHKQFFLGKSLPGACPTGPVVVTADEMTDPGQLMLRSWVNGELKQEASTEQMIFSVPAILAAISAVMPLVPGDLIATGTPAGVGFARKPPEFLHPGDRVECEVEGIGKLINHVV